MSSSKLRIELRDGVLLVGLHSKGKRLTAPISPDDLSSFVREASVALGRLAEARVTPEEIRELIKAVELVVSEDRELGKPFMSGQFICDDDLFFEENPFSKKSRPNRLSISRRVRAYFIAWVEGLLASQEGAPIVKVSDSSYRIEPDKKYVQAACKFLNIKLMQREELPYPYWALADGDTVPVGFLADRRGERLFCTQATLHKETLGRKR